MCLKLKKVVSESPLTYMKEKKNFCGFFMCSNQYLVGRVYDMCVYYMTGAPEGSPKVVFVFVAVFIGCTSSVRVG